MRYRSLVPCCVVLLAACGDDRPFAPVLSNISAITAEDTPLIVVVPLTAEDARAVTISIVTAPSHGTLTGSGPTWTYTPAANYAGGDTLTVSATDRHGTGTATVAITITPVDDAPVANPDSFATGYNAPLTIAKATLLANDTDIDSTALTVTAVAAVTGGHGTAAISGSDVVFTPDAGFVGAAMFSYTMSDGALTAQATVTVTVGPDQPPVAVDDTAAVLEDASATAIAVLGNDTDVDGGPKSIASVTQPANGSIVITGGGAGLTYAPNANYCNQQPLSVPLGGAPPPASPDTFTYMLSPGGSTATVSVTVFCVDDPPVAVNDTPTVAEGSNANVINVLANDLDIDAGPKAVASVTTPLHGTTAVTPGGASVTYTPDSGYCNQIPNGPRDTFSYTLTPGTSMATVSVTVTCTCGLDSPTDFVVGSSN